MNNFVFNKMRVARAIECLIGFYFIAGAIPKFLNVDKFAVLMAGYKVVVSPQMIQLSVLFTIFLEIALGMLLVFGVRLKGLTIIGLQLITVFFTVLIAYAWKVNGLEDCGCFPVFKMSPPVSIIKNVLILTGSIYILWHLVLFRKEKSPDAADKDQDALSQESRFSWQLRHSVVGLALSIIVSSACAGYAWRTFDSAALIEDGSGETGIFAQFELFMNEGYFNLAEGIHLVPVLSSSCPECKDKVPELNELFMNIDMPPMVALCYEENFGELDEFRAETNPIFPLHSIGDRALLYFRLIENEPFRLVLVEDGHVLASWDGFVPDAEIIEECMEGNC